MPLWFPWARAAVGLGIPRRIAVDVACVTEDGTPVPSAEVTLYEQQGWGLEYRQKAIKLANTRGLCRFEGVALPDPDVAFLTTGVTVWLCTVSAQAGGRATVMGSVLSGNVIGATATVALATAQELIVQADKALYVSKEKGRNRVTHFTDG